jgi:hypothetical protein
MEAMHYGGSALWRQCTREILMCQDGKYIMDHGFVMMLGLARDVLPNSAPT